MYSVEDRQAFIPGIAEASKKVLGTAALICIEATQGVVVVSKCLTYPAAPLWAEANRQMIYHSI